jgi:hypothetical protein
LGKVMTKIIAGHISGRLPQLRKRPRGNPAWVKGHNQAGPGRPKGSPDRYTRELKKALLDAVEFVGEEFAAAEAAEAAKQGRAVDPNAPRGVTAYLEYVARNHPQVMCAMLSRIMPQQTEATHTVEHQYKSLEEIGNRLRELGLSPGRIYPLLVDQKKSDEEVH